ncbi:MAG TPA: hypothetical protein VGH76_13725 [Actinomycetospora sp.]|jgi:hypothetical protein|uniref:hypothetical protein n=1 Tax=Actinomycetospora sp. TaxID=1872135 RepID=UPI002F40D42E
MAAIADRFPVEPTVKLRRRPAARPTASPERPSERPPEHTNGRSVTFEGAEPAVRTTPPRPVSAPVHPATPARHRADTGWGYPSPSAYPRTPVPPWAAQAPAGLATPSGPLAGPIYTTGPTALDALLRRWLP